MVWSDIWVTMQFGPHWRVMSAHLLQHNIDILTSQLKHCSGGEKNSAINNYCWSEVESHNECSSIIFRNGFGVTFRKIQFVKTTIHTTQIWEEPALCTFRAKVFLYTRWKLPFIFGEKTVPDFLVTIRLEAGQCRLSVSGQWRGIVLGDRGIVHQIGDSDGNVW